jgi:uncharacterized membrane protein YphA (DoxX/SURF4 family)
MAYFHHMLFKRHMAVSCVHARIPAHGRNERHFIHKSKIRPTPTFKSDQPTPMKIALWIAQSLLALVFLSSGAMKLFAFSKFAEGAPALAGHPTLVTFIGIVELAGAAGLILPGMTKIMPVLTTWAALGLATIMILATAFHLSLGEGSHAVVTLVLLILAVFVVVGRGFKNPGTGR